MERLAAAAARGAHRDPSRPAVSDRERALRAEEDQQDAAIYLTAAMAGLRRSELLALLWSDMDFAHSLIRVQEGYSAREHGQPKSRRSHTVPMADKLAVTLEALKQRGHHTAASDHVFVGRSGGPLDGSALRRRYLATCNAARLRPLRFHDLRHTFASVAINVATVVQVQAWMGERAGQRHRRLRPTHAGGDTSCRERGPVGRHGAPVVLRRSQGRSTRCIFFAKSTLPKAPSGKIQRYRCRHALESGRYKPVATVWLVDR